MTLKDVVRIRIVKECIKSGCRGEARPESNYCVLHNPHETREAIWLREAQAEVDAICTSLADLPKPEEKHGRDGYQSSWSVWA